jgi:microcystin-dependent protein
MSAPYVGEIRMVGFNFAPQGWALCNGSLLSISENEVLFNLLGTTYGGDGVNTFSLPDLRGRIPFHQGSLSGNVLTMGERAGAETVTLVPSQLPSHSHTLSASSQSGTQASPANGFWAKSSLEEFSTESPTQSMAAACILPVGGSQPHDNMPPFLVVNFIISLYGSFPSQG